MGVGLLSVGHEQLSIVVTEVSRSLDLAHPLHIISDFAIIRDFTSLGLIIKTKEPPHPTHPLSSQKWDFDMRPV